MPPNTRSKGVKLEEYQPKSSLAIDEYYRLLAFVKWSSNIYIGINNDANIDINNETYIDHDAELLRFELYFERNVFPRINSFVYPTYKQVKAKLRNEWRTRYAQTYGRKFSYLYKYGLKALQLNENELAKIEKFYKDILSTNTQDALAPSLTQETIEAAGIPRPTAITASTDMVNTQKPSIAQTPTKSETQSKAKSRLKNKKARPKNDALKLKGENTHFKIARRKTRNLGVEEKNAHPKSEMNRSRRNSSNPVNLEEITRLQNQVQLGYRFSLQERILNLKVPIMSADEISQKFDILFRRIQDTCIDVVRESNIDFQSDVYTNDLINSWSHKAFKSDLNGWLQTQIGGSMTTESLLVGVVGAAVIKLAFQPVFPKSLRRKSRLEKKQREILLRWGGPRCLRTADHASFSELIEDKRAEIIDKGSKEIADRIVEGLQQQQSGGTQNDDQLMYKPVEASDFMSILGMALKLKLDVTESMSRLKFIYFKPDEHFMDMYMERCRGSDHGTSKIKACIFPALFWEPNRDKMEDSGDCLLQYNADYNTYFTELVGDIASPSALVAKAMVLS